MSRFSHFSLWDAACGDVYSPGRLAPQIGTP